MKTYYKIIDILDDGVPYFLYHGVNGTKRIPMRKWLTATVKPVTDGSGGTEYTSGFHVFKSFEDATEYLKYFKRPYKRIAKVQCMKLRKKKHSRTDVFLADRIKFIGFERS